MSLKRLIWLIAIPLLATACSPQKMVIRQMADVVDNGMSAFERDDDLELVEKAFPANIKLLEAMLANSPDDRQLMILLSRLYGSYAFGFVETHYEENLFITQPSESEKKARDALKDQVSRYYAKGGAYALSALESRVSGATDSFKKINAIRPYLDKLGESDVAALFWYGFNLGAWVNRNLDSVRAISQAHVARAIMERVIELNPDFYHGGAHLFLMVYFGSRSSTMGGNQEKALHHYHQLKQIAGDGYLLPDLFYARYSLQQRREREAFVGEMHKIMDDSPGDSNTALHNAIAVRRAAIYLSAVDVLFEPR